MNSLLLLLIFDSVYLCALAIWIGSTFFWITGVLPVVSNSISISSEARGRVCKMLARYCTGVLASAALALASLVYSAIASPSLRGVRVGFSAVLIIVAALTVLSISNGLIPRIEKTGLDQKREENLLWRKCRQRCLILIGLGVVLLVGYAFRGPTPPTSPQGEVLYWQ